MIELTRPRDLARLRRLALVAQGLLQAQPFGRGLAGARNAINHIGYVQIDTISVVERAHHHVLYSRVPKFKPAMTNQMLLDGDIFEYWHRCRGRAWPHGAPRRRHLDNRHGDDR